MMAALVLFLIIVLLYIAWNYYVIVVRPKHFDEAVKRRENELSWLSISAGGESPAVVGTRATLVSGSIVLTPNRFQIWWMSVLNFFGGRLTSYDHLYEMARREAVCRMKEEAMCAGALSIVNVRYETTDIARNLVEVTAYGTAFVTRKGKK